MTDRLRRAYLSSVIHQDAEFFENVGPGEVGTRMIKDVASVRAAIVFDFSMSTLIVAIVMAFSRAPRLAGVVFSIIPFSFIAFTIIGQLSSKAEGRLLTIDGQASTLLEQILSSVRVVQSFAAETFLAKKYDAYLQRLQRIAKWRSIVRGMELAMANCVISLIYSLTFWYGSRLVVGDGLEVGLMFTIFWNMFNALFSVVNILPHILAIKDSISVSAQLLKDIERVPKIDICRTDGAKLWEDEKVNAQIALRDGGKVTALVGASGSGKSTIAALLMRYYDPSNGQLLLTGHDSRSLNLAWLRSQISLVSQEPQLFTASIFENVAYGLPGQFMSYLPTPPRITWEFVCNLPEGMDTRVSGARTGVLSGGQRQRIAAARALKLMKAIHKEQTETGMTTILIAHRLSSIQNADKIIAMSNGKVVEEGTYQELMALGGVFSNLVKHQISATQPSSQKPETSGTERVAPPTLSASPRLIKSALTLMDRPSQLIRRLWNVANPSRKMQLVVCRAASGASFPIAAWLIGFVMKTFSIQDDDARLLREARKWSFWFLILAIINIGTSFVVGFFLSAGADRIDRRLRIVSLTSLLKQEIGYFDKEENASGALTAAIATHANNIASAIGLVWQQLVSATGNFVGSLVLGLVLSWKLTLLGISPIPFIVAAAYYNIIFIEKYERQIQKPREEASAFASENVDAIKTVAALGREDAVMQQFDKSASKYSAKGRNLAIGAIGFGVGLYSSFEAIVIAGRYKVPAGAACIMIFHSGYSASRMFTFIPDWARMVHGFRNKVEGELTFSSCTLKYASRPKPAVSDVSFTIKPGQSIAFCGPSGGGKSSIISMISRFYDPTTGTISLDGQDIRYIPLEEYRGHIALVSQDAILYEGTFHENITLGEASISQEQLERACRDASILEFIQSLPQGFDTSVGFKGSQMSGGQRQRICIARALLRNPKILLLDEATSALDAESERSVKEALEQASKGRTTISIAHRLSTIQGADVIHVVEEGRIVESGSHLELLALNGRYVDLIRSQL
ncbi:ABC transporter transmembrane region [Rhizoctonia solani]|uniref:ABC transporter transmembrane region n=1 Tax=Rhizoctonia solani TaxID=456999 RepID=A0A8H7LZB4_9AGAM|nr:ABC transporter transmembrane region [Rhizoctonia solani]